MTVSTRHLYQSHFNHRQRCRPDREAQEQPGYLRSESLSQRLVATNAVLRNVL